MLQLCDLTTSSDFLSCLTTKVIDGIRRELRLPAAALQIPIGAEEGFEGVVDIIDRVAYKFEGHKGTTVTSIAVPEDLEDLMEEKRAELVDRLSDCDGLLTDYLYHIDLVGLAAYC